MRLYYLDRPKVRLWRQRRHQKSLPLFDSLDNMIIDYAKQTTGKITAIDFGGWYLQQEGIGVTCVESNDISKWHYNQCMIEYDLKTWRPTYVSQTDLVVFKYPWFLKYALLEELIVFFSIWITSPVLIEFQPRYIQHNHLKYNLLDLVKSQRNYEITLWSPLAWFINPVNAY
jgi:hypothetical protein